MLDAFVQTTVWSISCRKLSGLMGFSFGTGTSSLRTASPEFWTRLWQLARFLRWRSIGQVSKLLSEAPGSTVRTDSPAACIWCFWKIRQDLLWAVMTAGYGSALTHCT
ncbi:unnamed protein product [Symbiodinium sp. CCMP2592]|nr:unnamed protein product [Symbiodinium sp. CCMP2592]